MTAASSPEMLLLQIRDPANEPALLQERGCFRDMSGLASPRLTAVNLVTEPNLTWEWVDRFEVLLIGGAGSHSVTVEYPFTAPLAAVVRRWVEEGRPLLGSCWGHQFVAWALGGAVVTDGAREEVGTFDIHLTPEGQEDPLLAGLPATFPVHLGHHDVVSELPPGMIEMAYSDLGRNQVVRCVGKPVYGTQFHLEMTMERMAARLRMYPGEYLSQGDLDQHIQRILRPTPDAEGLLCRFLSTLDATPVVNSNPESAR